MLEAFILGPESSKLSRNIEDYPEGIIIPINKPYRWTSADVIRKIKSAAIRHFGKKNLKVGHAGTLDPLATGVLLVCIGKATKLAEKLQSHDKEYIAGITFGATTPSYDLEKDIDRFFPYGHITESLVSDILPMFIGEQDQTAPLFSAKSVDGVRAYELARKLHKEGKTLDEAAQALIRVSRINITSLELLEFTAASDGIQTFSESDSIEQETGLSKASARINVTDNSSLGLPRAVIRMSCSKGTYVRAFARDLGESMSSGAHLDSLQRSRSGIFRIEDSITVEQATSLLYSNRND
ncbi:MAG: tRNA pseudouridine(55) synthase TruB [Bacteroidales bacterium]|nr:tRNA pseudouridine(55) synthase TruB [Bacteroidales bacterium]